MRMEKWKLRVAEQLSRVQLTVQVDGLIRRAQQHVEHPQVPWLKHGIQQHTHKELVRLVQLQMTLKVGSHVQRRQRVRLIVPVTGVTHPVQPRVEQLQVL